MNESQRPADQQETKTRIQLQVSLLTVLLLTAAIAIAVAYQRDRKEIQTIRSQLPGLKKVDRALIVIDRNKVSVVGKIPTRLHECIYDVYIPANQTYQIHLALDNVDQKGLADATRTMALPSGRHTIEISKTNTSDVSTTRILIDGLIAMKETRDKDWDPGKGSSGAGEISDLMQFEGDFPIVLFRQRFMVAKGNGYSSPNGPSAGILVWIERSNDENE